MWPWKGLVEEVHNGGEGPHWGSANEEEEEEGEYQITALSTSTRKA